MGIHLSKMVILIISILLLILHLSLSIGLLDIQNTEVGRIYLTIVQSFGFVGLLYFLVWVFMCWAFKDNEDMKYSLDEIKKELKEIRESVVKLNLRIKE